MHVLRAAASSTSFCWFLGFAHTYALLITLAQGSLTAEELTLGQVKHSLPSLLSPEPGGSAQAMSWQMLRSCSCPCLYSEPGAGLRRGDSRELGRLRGLRARGLCSAVCMLAGKVQACECGQQ